MDSNYANAGGGISGGGTAAAGAVAIGIAAGVSGRYNAVNCQRSVPYSVYDPYGGGSAGVRVSSAYPYDAEAEFKERTGMGKAKPTHLQMAGNTVTNSAKIQQQHSYNPNSCYGSYNQSATALTPESAHYYAYAYDQHNHYPQQQQQYHQSQLQQQYKYNVSAKAAAQQQQQHIHQQQNLATSAVNTMKISPPEYGYAPYHHLQHPYYHPHYHSSQKGGVSVMKTIPDTSAMPYVNSKMIHSAVMGGARAPQYPSNYSYHPHSYPSAASTGHHTYQSQSVCDESRWLWNNSSGGIEYQNNCRSAYPAYVNGASAKQTTMWPSVPMQYQNNMSTGYPAAAVVANQSCCSPAESAANYYPQQYVKYPGQSLSSTAMDYNGSNNDLYGNSQVNSAPSAASATAKVYTDLNAQPQANSYQTMNTSSVSYHQPSDYSASAGLDYNARYLQQQQTDLPSSTSTSTSSYNHHYYHNLHPYAHQAYSSAEPQENLYAQQQVDTKISVTTKSQNLRDFLTTWNEDEDEGTDRTMSSTDIPFIDQLHLAADHFSQSQGQQQTNPFVENHLQFKGSFTSRPKIHVGITVDSTVESDQYINLPDIIIDIEKSSKDVVSLPEDILVANTPKIEKEELFIKEEKQVDINKKKPTPPPKKPNDLHRGKNIFRRKISGCKGLSRSQLLKLRLIQRNQRKSKLSRKLPRPKIRRVKKPSTQQSRLKLNPQSLKSLCVSLMNSDKFRNRILGPSEVENLINLTTVNEVNIDTIAVSIQTTGGDISSSSSVIPKLSDLCKNALNSSFDRDVLVINLDEILDSDNLFVVQCDINENILEDYVDQQILQEQQQQHDAEDTNNDLVEILNDNNNNYNSGSNSSNYIPTAAVRSETTTTTIHGSDTEVVTRTIEELKRCCSVTEVSNLPLDNAVKHNNNFNSSTINPLVHRLLLSPPSPRSTSCPAELGGCSSSPLIEQNCPTQQIAVGHEQLHEMLMLSEIVQHDVINVVDGDDDRCHRRRYHPNDSTISDDDGELLMMASAEITPSIHHEEIVPDNMKKFQNEKFLKYLHAKYVQGNLSEFYHANRIIKKYKKRIIKKILNIVR